MSEMSGFLIENYLNGQEKVQRKPSQWQENTKGCQCQIDQIH
jgi:hypothetical protein